MQNETKHITIDAVVYDADRITDGAGIGYIELRQPGSSELLARINYHGHDTPMDVCTYGKPLPLPTVEWLLQAGREKLA
jgi:hypothetical protein